jgi:hypothetical protein
LITAVLAIVAGALCFAPAVPSPLRGVSRIAGRSRMSLAAFRVKWSAPEIRSRTEEAVRHEYLLDLLAVLGLEPPASLDPGGQRWAFEALVTKDDGATGYVDLAYDRCAVEVKRPGSPLGPALVQLRGYSGKERHFPALIATNVTDEIAVHTNFTAGRQYASRFEVAALNRRAVRVLRTAMTDPDRLRPGRFGNLAGFRPLPPAIPTP